MKILMVGGGDKGAWQMRGVQLGAAMGARVTNNPTKEQVQWADVVVLVKRAGLKYAQLVHNAKKPLVWDALDFWEQPDQNALTEEESKVLLRNVLSVICPTLTIAATKRMAKDADGIYLPHHSWPGLVPTPPRELVHTVGYQGNARYLGQWREVVQQECDRRGWKFVINPDTLDSTDILVAFRDGKWDGWMCQNWKSGVKFVNALASGRPIVHDYSISAEEIGVAGSCIGFNNRHLIPNCFDAWDAVSRRLIYEQVSRSNHYQRYSLESVAAEYRRILDRAA